MTEIDKKTNPLLVNLVFSLSQAALMQMGKVSNPVTGKTERNLNQAKVSIDMLEMLKEKTIGNLSNEELKFLGDSVAQLQLNFADEANKKDQDGESKDTTVLH